MKFIQSVLLIVSLLVFSDNARGSDIIYNRQDSLIYESYIEKHKGQANLPVNEIIINTAKYFLGKPYTASTLEASDKEKLIINLREFDCTTLVENCIALSLTIKSGDLSFKNYSAILMKLRYRNGEIKGYTSRLHYTSDWIYENERQNIIKDITANIGGKNIPKRINFMSTHPQLYKHLKNNPQNINKLKETEEDIYNRNHYIIIPKSLITKHSEGIKNGDIIGFATSVPGLDYSHIGIAYWEEENLHFIHASSKMKEVVIEEKTLSDYCVGSKSCSGISVLRVNDKKL